MLNKATLIGHVGQSPDIRAMSSGDQVASFSLATSEHWKDKATGEKKERTQWHKIVVFNSGLVKLTQNYVTKGSKIMVEGQIETRKWTDKEGKDQYTTEIVLRPYQGSILLLDSMKGGNNPPAANSPDDYGHQP